MVGTAHGDFHYFDQAGQYSGNPQASGSWDVGNGSHQHPGGLPGPNRRPVIPAGRRRGGRVTHQLRRGGRPAPRGRGRAMARGGSTRLRGKNIRKFHVGGNPNFPHPGHHADPGPPDLRRRRPHQADLRSDFSQRKRYNPVPPPGSAASAMPTGQPSAQGGGQGPLQYMMNKGKELWGKHKEGAQRFQDEYERRNIKSGYWEGESEKTDTEKMSEDWAAGGSQNPDKIRTSAVSKKDYMDKIKAQREWEESEEGQLYKNQTNEGMSAQYKQQMGSPGGFLNWGLNKMFGPKFEYETKSSDVYDIPPEFRGNN